MRRSAKVITLFTATWLLSGVAFSNGSLEPELPILANARNSVEYPILRRINDLTLELQLLEITVKNRRDNQIEEKISTAIKDIETDGAAISGKFKAMRADQLDELWALFNLGKSYGKMMGVPEAEWDELLGALREGQITAGMLGVHARAGVFNLVSLTPLTIGKQLVWHVTLPEFDKHSYWVQARVRARYLGVKGTANLSGPALLARAEKLDAPYAGAEKLTKDYFTSSYAKLYSAFESQRYAILQRVQLARNALVELQKNNSAMGTPEEYSTLYNQLLDNLFSYGVDISLSGSPQRDFAVKGFLFAESPERSEELLKKLRFTPSATTYNPPST